MMLVISSWIGIIHDAIEAGFNHVVFIIRKDIEKEVKEVIALALFTLLIM